MRAPLLSAACALLLLSAADPATAQRRKRTPPSPPPPAPVIEPACRTPSHSGSTGRAGALAEFESSYPQQYRHGGGLKKVMLSRDEMRRLMIDLSCFASWPLGEQAIPKLATPLFRSKQHRGPAFAALESIEHDPRSGAHLQAVARNFAAEMRYRIELEPPLWGLAD